MFEQGGEIEKERMGDQGGKRGGEEEEEQGREVATLCLLYCSAKSHAKVARFSSSLYQEYRVL
eukprot:1754296-Rhodomonas_salina.1